jgi:type VI secretion system protein VasJ
VISALGEDLDGIDRFLAENMEDAPGLRRLLDITAVLETAAAEPAEAKPETELQKAPEPESPAAGPAPTEPSTGIQTEEGIQRALRGGLGKIREVAAFYMDQNLFHPLGYRLNRIAAWTPVEELPPSTDGKTRIPPPPQQIITAIETLYQGGDWQGLLKTAESRVGEFLFWFDLSRFAAESMDHLGHENLRDLIAGEAALFVSRLKGLDALCFSDGKPFADNETKAWLKQSTSSEGTQEALEISALSGASTDEVQAKIAEAYTKAQGLVKKKKIGDAVSLLHRQLCDGASGKEKLLWRIALSQLLVSAKKEKTAVPHLMDILQDVDRYHLEQWEPDLALQAMMGIYTGFRSQKGEEFKPKAAEILDRIAGLNPAQALKLK